MTRLLFVCLGNICRSPTGEAIMRRLVLDAGLGETVEIDSAGTAPWHAGNPPDTRSTAAAASRGIVIEGASRQVTREDFARFDLLLCADGLNEADLLALAPDPAAAAKVRRLREFDSAAVAAGALDVPDPYQGGPEGFEHVLDLVQAACEGLLEHVRASPAQ